MLKLIRWSSVLGIIALSNLTAAAQERFEWRAVIEPGKTLEIKGVNGSIEAALADGSAEAEVVATKSGARDDLDDVTFDVVEDDGNFTVCAVYPSARRNRNNECRSGEGGRMDVPNNFDVTVQFVVSVPARVNLIARSVNGSIEAHDIDGNVEAYTVNGRVEIDASGTTRARTVNGSIVASMNRSDWEGTLEFETVNGQIQVGIPPDVGANFEARTVNGSISSDLPLTVLGRLGPRRVTGTIQGTVGPNGRGLRIETVNGNIRLRESR